MAELYHRPGRAEDAMSAPRLSADPVDERPAARVARGDDPARQRARAPRLASTGAAAWILTTLSVLAGVAAWAFASRALDSPLFPSPLQILRALAEILGNGVLVLDIAVSVRRIAIGFVLGCAVGIPLGLAMGLFPVVRAFCDPIVQFLRFVPPIAWLIPAIMWFGIGETSKIAIIFYMTVFLVLLNTMSGVAAIPRNQIRSAENFGLTGWQLFAWIVFPATVSYSVAGARIAMGNSFAAVVGAELIAADAGLGYRIVDSGQWMAMDQMFAAMLVLGVLGIAADRLARLATSRWLRRYVRESDHAV
jgi:ABC-type nitrate/sulfonate/bicarbonate transport system permease component